MIRPQRERRLWLNAFSVYALPLIALLLSAWHVATHGLALEEAAVGAALFWLSGLGITAGYHRLYAHRAYEARPSVKLGLAVLGAMAWQNSIIRWAATHRRHHARVDSSDDPHDATRGFWFSHLSWTAREDAHERDLSGVVDLMDDPICRWQHRHWLSIAMGSNVVPILCLGLYFDRLLGLLIIAGLLRIVLVHQCTFSINSLAHMFGGQEWSRSDSSRDNWLLSFVTLGEGYHNYHHAFPRDYRNGVHWYHWDPTKWFIFFMHKVGFVSRLRRADPHLTLVYRFRTIDGLMDPSIAVQTAGRGLSEIIAARNDASRKLAILGERSRQWHLRATDSHRAAPAALSSELRALRRALRRSTRSASASLARFRRLARRPGIPRVPS